MMSISPLPNYQQAVIEESKLVGYALNPASERGQHKARLFEAVLGFNLTNWQQLRQEILVALPYHEAIIKSETPFGKKYEVVMTLMGITGRKAAVMTVWQFDRLPDATLADYPRLITVYLK